MSGRYGRAFVAELVQEGRYDEAVEAATADIDEGRATAETWAERATARELLEEFPAALDDFERAIALNREKRAVDPEDLDDRYFSALVAAATEASARSKDDAVATLARYDRTIPGGRHAKDAITWRARFRGEIQSLLDKTVESN